MRWYTISVTTVLALVSVGAVPSAAGPAGTIVLPDCEGSAFTVSLECPVR